MRRLLLLLLLGIMLLSTCVFAQSDAEDVAGALAALGIAGAIIFVYIAVIVAVYLFFAIGLMKIAKKLDVDNAWFAFIPILNVVLMLQCAEKPIWWLIFMFIPGVNAIAGVVISVLCWMVIAERLGKESWWGLIIGLVPIANIIFFIMLAYGKTETVARQVPSSVN